MWHDFWGALSLQTIKSKDQPGLDTLPGRRGRAGMATMAEMGQWFQHGWQRYSSGTATNATTASVTVTNATSGSKCHHQWFQQDAATTTGSATNAKTAGAKSKVSCEGCGRGCVKGCCYTGWRLWAWQRSSATTKVGCELWCFNGCCEGWQLLAWQRSMGARESASSGSGNHKRWNTKTTKFKVDKKVQIGGWDVFVALLKKNSWNQPKHLVLVLYPRQNAWPEILLKTARDFVFVCVCEKLLTSHRWN